MSAIDNKGVELTGLGLSEPSYGLKPTPLASSGASYFSLLTQAQEFVSSCKMLFTGSKDRELIVNAVMRICSNIPSFIYSGIYLGNIVLSILSVAKVIRANASLKAFAHWLGPLGLATSFIDSMFTTVKLRRTREFMNGFHGDLYKKLPKDLEDPKIQSKLEKIAQKYSTLLEESPAIKKSVEALQKGLSEGKLDKEHLSILLEDIADSCVMEDLLYLRNNFLPIPKGDFAKMDSLAQERFTQYTNEAKASRLAGRVQPWCQEKISNELPTILENIRSGDEETRAKAKEEAKHLLEITKKQGNKAYFIQVASLVLLATSIVGYIALMVACPYLIPVTLLVIGAIGFIGVGTYSNATIDCEGSDYKMSNNIPNWFKAYILGMDLEKDSKNANTVLDAIKAGNFKIAKEKADEIENKYLRAKAYFSIVHHAKEDELLEKIKELSLFYFHRAEESLKARSYT